jgi:hypothetical protein
MIYWWVPDGLSAIAVEFFVLEIMISVRIKTTNKENEYV